MQTSLNKPDIKSDFYLKKGELLFEAHNISLGYNTKESLFQSTNFKLHAGDFTFITGSSGSGKTSFLNYMQDPYALYQIGGSSKRYFLQNKKYFLSRVYQDQRVFSSLTVKKNLELAYDSNLYNSYDEFFDSMLRFLKVFGVEGFINKKLSDCHGACFQKVSIIRTVLSKPQIVFLDEPTNFLDEKSKHRVYELFSLLNHKSKMTVVWVTHDKSLIQKFYGDFYYIENKKLKQLRSECFI